MKPIDELTFIDDYMFGEVMKSRDICIGVLERLTGLEIEDIEYPQLQKSLKAGYESHGIRLDVYVKDSSTVYDIELQNRHYGSLGRRTRFYQSLIDADCLLKGMDYSRLPRTLIIFICTGDPFGLGLPRYTFTTRCMESDEANLDDSTEKIIYNSSAYKTAEDENLRAFLKFVSENKSTDSFTEKLLDQTRQIKRDEIFRKEYMSMGIWETDIREQATKEGYEAGRMDGISLGMEQGFQSGKAEGIEQGFQSGITEGVYQKSVEDALVLIRDFNVPVEIAAQKMGAPLDMVIAELEKEGGQ